MQRFVPGIYHPTVNPHVRGLLYSYATEDDLIVQAIKDAKEQLFQRTAQRQYLNVLGSNVGVFRPTGFNLADPEYRLLIPALSYAPKQMAPTIQKVLDIFFGVGNPDVLVKQINPNELVIQLPSSVPSLRRTLKGSVHLHSYLATITAVDNVFKTMTIDLNDPLKTLKVDELANATVGQDLLTGIVASNTAGTTGVTLQFFAATDLSPFSLIRNINMILPGYPGSFIPDRTSAFSVTKQRGILGQVITAGQILPSITMTDASGIPDQAGEISFNFGRNNEESQVKYFGRPNNTTLLINPAYTFLQDHTIGSPVNFTIKPYSVPRTNGSDYSVYLVGVTAARILAQQIVQTIVAAGVVIRFIILEPECE